MSSPDDVAGMDAGTLELSRESNGRAVSNVTMTTATTTADSKVLFTTKSPVAIGKMLWHKEVYVAQAIAGGGIAKKPGFLGAAAVGRV